MNVFDWRNTPRMIDWSDMQRHAQNRDSNARKVNDKRAQGIEPSAPYSPNGRDTEPKKFVAPLPQSVDLYPVAVALVRKVGKPSMRLLESELKIGHQASQRLMDKMEMAGVVSPMQPNGRRVLL